VTANALLLCHRRRREVGRNAFFRDWPERRATLVAEHGAALGWRSYYQVHRVGRLNLLYRAIRLSRSWPVTALVSLLRGLAPHPLRYADLDVREERWDLVEVFAWPHATALEAGLGADGAAALGVLADDAAAHARGTAAVTAERVETASAAGTSAPGVVTLYCLRPRAGTSAAAMLAYWLDAHARLVAGRERGLRYTHYEQFAVRDPRAASELVTTSHRAPPFVGVAALSYAGFGDLWRGLISPRTQLANLELVWDEAGFLDPGRSALVLGRVRHRARR
jgi:hypothetical protein